MKPDGDTDNESDQESDEESWTQIWGHSIAAIPQSILVYKLVAGAQIYKCVQMFCPKKAQSLKGLC